MCDIWIGEIWRGENLTPNFKYHHKFWYRIASVWHKKKQRSWMTVAISHRPLVGYGGFWEASGRLVGGHSGSVQATSAGNRKDTHKNGLGPSNAVA